MQCSDIHRRQLAARLGLGCSRLLTGRTVKSARRLVEVALEAGFQHFDVAPSYGHGLAEDVLGSVLAGAPGQVTVGTKVGIGRPRNPGVMRFASAIARPVLHGLPALWKRASIAARRASAPVHLFQPEYVRRMLDDSLRRLRRDRVDVYLLHEVSLEDVTDALVSLLLELRHTGRVGAAGPASSRETAEEFWVRYPELCDAVQYRWTIFDSPLRSGTRPFVITHGSILGALSQIEQMLRATPAVGRMWSEILGRDLFDLECVADLLVAIALVENQSGTVLVSSTRSDRIRRFASIPGDTALLADGVRLRGLLSEAPAEAEG